MIVKKTYTPTNDLQKYIFKLGKTSSKDQFHDITAIGARFSSKTFAGGCLALQWLMAQPCKVLLVRRARSAMSDSILSIYKNHIFPPEIIVKTNNLTGRMEFVNGSVLVTAGSTFIDDLRSLEVSGAILEEANQLTRNDFDIVLPCIREKHKLGNFIFCISNGVAKNHWLAQHSREEGVKHFGGTIWDNPFISDAVKNKMVQTFGADSHWCKGGLAGDDEIVFNGLHEIFEEAKEFNSIPERCIIGIDAGGGGASGVSRAALVLIEEYKNGYYKVVDEIFLKSSVYPEIFANLNKWRHITRHVASDPANSHFNRELRAKGFNLLHVRKSNKESQEQLINSMLASETLIIDDVCKETLSDFSQYRGKELFSDGPDAVRYGIISVVYSGSGVSLAKPIFE